ncbi:MAG: hypothetical protein M1822_007215 [Bathelium mastoideum]|nr:MAG: hypothetical protein M1822_007215 [Bathelium mastoideum]
MATRRQRNQYAPLQDKTSLSDNHATRCHREGATTPPAARNRASKRLRYSIVTERVSGSPVRGTAGSPNDDDPPSVDPEDGQYLVEGLLEMRVRPVGKRSRLRITQYLVKWEGNRDEHNCWVNADDIHDGLMESFLAVQSQP